MSAARADASCSSRARWGYQAIGVDIEEAPVRWGREELDWILRLAAPNKRLTTPPVDIVSLWNVLEHVTDPLGLLRAIRAAMAPS